MATKQSVLEKEAILERNKEVIKNDYSRNDEYSSGHEDALSDPSNLDKPLGKGTNHGGHTHTIPDYTKPKDLINYSNFDTFGGGGSGDIHGRNGQGGRIHMQTINTYSKDNAYGPNSVDMTSNIIDGQFIIK